MVTPQVALRKLRRICLSLPDTHETLTWGKPHFRVADKIFAGFGEDKGTPVVGFKLEMGHAKQIIRDPRFWPAPYVGHKGWVSMKLAGIEDWDELRSLIFESYRLIDPKRSFARMETVSPPPRPRRNRTAAPGNKARKKAAPHSRGARKKISRKGR